MGPGSPTARHARAASQAAVASAGLPENTQVSATATTLDIRAGGTAPRTYASQVYRPTSTGTTHQTPASRGKQAKPRSTAPQVGAAVAQQASERAKAALAATRNSPPDHAHGAPPPYSDAQQWPRSAPAATPQHLSAPMRSRFVILNDSDNMLPPQHGLNDRVPMNNISNAPAPAPAAPGPAQRTRQQRATPNRGQQEPANELQARAAQQVPQAQLVPPQQRAPQEQRAPRAQGAQGGSRHPRRRHLRRRCKNRQQRVPHNLRPLWSHVHCCLIDAVFSAQNRDQQDIAISRIIQFPQYAYDGLPTGMEARL